MFRGKWRVEMPFSWYHADLPTQTDARRAARANGMYERELAEKAALLQRLGHSLEQTQARLRANIEWDFEMNGGRAAIVARIDAIAKAVYHRRGVGPGIPTI